MNGVAGPVRVLLVDDQALFREALGTLLSVRDDIEVVGEAAVGEHDPDLGGGLGVPGRPKCCATASRRCVRPPRWRPMSC
jgi:hypothetical protein